MRTSAQTRATQPLQFLSPLGPDALFLVGMTGSEGISKLFRFEVDLLADNRREIDFAKLLGQPVGVALALGGDKGRHYYGVVSRFSQGGRDTTFTRYRAEIVPPLWILTKRVQSRIFQHETVPDILKKVLAGFDVRFEIKGTFHPRNYCVQYRESDFDFISRLMEEEGIYYFFTHGDEGHKLVVANTPDSHPDMPAQPSAVFDEMHSNAGRGDFRVTAWERAQEIRPGKVTLWDHCFELPHQELAVGRTGQDSVEVGSLKQALKLSLSDQLEIYEYPGGFSRRFDGIDAGGGERPADIKKIFEDNERTAAIRMQQETMGAVQIRGSSNCRQFVSGHKFALRKHFNADGQYVVTGIEHEVKLGGDYRSGDGVMVNYENRFTCIPLALPFRPARSTPRPRVDGAQTATVVGPKGEEIFTDKYGRVKVHFPWDREGKKDANSSCWVRVSTPWAGKGWGGVHVPRIGQEVVVDFLEGDPDRPIIVGSVYNAEQMPPFALPGSKQISGFKTNSYPTSGGSNEITFDDTKGKEKMTVHAQFDKNVTVDNDLTTLVKNNRKSTVNVNSTELVVGTKGTTVNGAVTETYNSGLSTIVKGGVMVAETSANIHVIAATEVMLNSGASTLLLKSDGTIELTGVNITINGKSLVDVMAPKVNVVGGAEALLGVGGQTVLCDGGQVAVSGAQITASAEGTHNITGALVKIN